MVEQVKKKEGVIISNETINWMRKTKEEFIATDGDDMIFDQEYPSHRRSFVPKRNHFRNPKRYHQPLQQVD